MQTPTPQEIDGITTVRSQQEAQAIVDHSQAITAALAQSRYMQIALAVLSNQIDIGNKEGAIASAISNGIRIGFISGYNRALRSVYGTRN